MMNKTAVEGYKVFTHYAVLNLGTTRENKAITKTTQLEVLRHYHGVEKGGELALSKTLRDPDKDITKQTKALVIMYEDFFKDAANKVIEAWEVEIEGMKPRDVGAT